MVKNINNFYFTDEEFNIFAQEYQDKRTQYLETMRKEIQTKLLDLNDDILKIIHNDKKLDIFNHYNSSNITSLTFPCWFNKGKVNWLGVRYGKHPADIKALNKIVGTRSSDDPKYAFQKHACLQVNIGYSGVEIGIFHAVPDNAVDRLYLHDHIDNADKELLDQIQTELNKLRGYGYEWNIWNTNSLEEKIYKFDIENDESFIDWYSKNDEDGCYSSMLVRFPRYDERINKDNIVKTIIDIFTQLYPLYKLLSWNIHYTGKVEV